MPVYEYKCEQCEKVEEVLHSMTETPDVNCPDCGAPCGRIISSFKIHGTEASRTFEYNAVKTFRDGAEERRKAQEASHMGPNPYDSIDSVSPDIIDSL